MALFGKKKKKGEEDDEIEVKDGKGNRNSDPGEGDEEFEKIPPSLRRKRIENKAFKDLQPENQKKRKEPIKPWGKKERLIVFVVMIVTIGISGFLALSSREWKVGGAPRLETPNIEAPIFGTEKIIIDGRAKDKESSDLAIDSLKNLINPLTGVYGVYVIRLDNGYSYGIREKEIFQAASLIKLPVMAAMYAEAERGNIDLDSKYVLQAGDKVGGSGSLYGRPVGYEITYRNIVELMGKQSDNTAFRIARKALGDATINEYMNKYGMKNTNLEENLTTPEDIGTFFEGIWTNNMLSPRHKNALLDSLTDTLYEAWLPAGIPDDVRVAHKYGREVHVINDAGIVFTPKPYVVVVMSKGIVDSEGDFTIPEASKIIFDIEGGL